VEELVYSHLHFTIARRRLTGRVLIPKFYDPDLDSAASVASKIFDLPLLSDVLTPGRRGSQLGVWLPRENYGSGSIPFIRTSDFFHWRIRSDFKKGVSEEVYARYKHRIDIQPNDILFVAHGTYLIGDVALVSESDLPMLLQDHVYRLRVRPESKVDPYLLLAALSTRFVRRQVRARQFSAEIIDKIGERHLSIRVPVPKDAKTRQRVVEIVRTILELHATVKDLIAKATTTDRTPGPRAVSHYGFQQRRARLINRILIPRYYDPELESDLKTAEVTDGQPWTTLGQLVDSGVLSVSTGVEVGKMAYGTGTIPFIRTSDLVNWELFRDPTQGVSEQIYGAYTPKGTLQEGDIVVVRDGTYLVGSSALVLKEDLPALFCGGLFRLRAVKKEGLSTEALLGLLNLPLVRRQMRSKQFTRDVIDTLGPRLLEVRVPSRGTAAARVMEKAVNTVMSMKAEIKTSMHAAIELLEPSVPASALNRPGWSMR
jgi:hypothetical protein